MNLKIFVLTFFALLINSLQAQNIDDVKEEETFYYSYPVKDITSLSVVNKYGNINYSGTSRDSIFIEATIRLKNPDNEDISEIFGMINLNPKLLKQKLEIKTEFRGSFSSNDEFTVTYMIKGPPQLSLVFNNQFGDIVFESFSGNADITIDYGNFSAIDPFAKLKIKLKNGKTNLTEIGVVNAELSNAQFFLKKTDHIELKAEFSNINIGNASLVNANGQTSEFVFNEVKNLSVSGLQCFVKSSVIKNSGLFEIQKGSLTVNKILSSTENISVAVVETPVQLGLDTKMTYTIHGEISSGNFEHPEKNRLRMLWEDQTLSFSGEAGKQNSSDSQTEIILFSEKGNIIIKYVE